MLLPLLSLIFATVLTATVVYMTVTTESGALSQNYRKILVFIAIYTYFVDLVLHVVGAQKVHWPCVYFQGILQGYTHTDSALSLSFSLISMSWSIIPYGIAMIYRHQIVQVSTARFHFRRVTIVAFLVCVAAAFSSIGFSFDYMLLSPAATQHLLSTQIPAAFVLEAGNHTIHCHDVERVNVFLVNVGCVIGSATIFLIAVPVHIQATLRQHSEMSDESKRLFWKCTQALIVQTMSPCLFAAVPGTIISTLYALERPAGVLFDACVAMMHSHSMAYSISAIVTTSPIRTRLANCFSGRDSVTRVETTVGSKQTTSTQHSSSRY